MQTCVLIQKNHQHVERPDNLHFYISPLQPTYKEETAVLSRVLITPAFSNPSTISHQHHHRKPTQNPPTSFHKKSDKSLQAQLEITSKWRNAIRLLYKSYKNNPLQL